MNDLALVKLDNARMALAECKTAMDSKQVADVAEAARVYLERTNASAETVNRATEIRLLAERQMGEFLKAMPKATGYEYGAGGRVDGIRPEPATKAPRLRDIGITNQQSHLAQKLADIPAEEFAERIAVVKAGGEKLSTAKIIHLGPQSRRSPVRFDLNEWEKHTRTILLTRMRDVPNDQRADAVKRIIQIAEAIST